MTPSLPDQWAEDQLHAVAAVCRHQGYPQHAVILTYQRGPGDVRVLVAADGIALRDLAAALRDLAGRMEREGGGG